MSITFARLRTYASGLLGGVEVGALAGGQVELVHFVERAEGCVAFVVAGVACGGLGGDGAGGEDEPNEIGIWMRIVGRSGRGVVQVHEAERTNVADGHAGFFPQLALKCLVRSFVVAKAAAGQDMGGVRIAHHEQV